MHGLASRAKYALIRNLSPGLRDLRRRLAPAVEGRDCLVFGSAPDPVVPQMASNGAIICINGSGSPVRRLGLRDPDLTIMSSNVTILKKDVRVETIRHLDGLHSTHLLLFRGSEETQRRALDALQDAGYRCDDAATLADRQYVAIASGLVPVSNILSRGDERISTGVFAVAVATWLRARSIVLAGFSLAGGHSYIAGDTPRNHVSADAAFFASIIARGLPVTTTSRELAARFGIPLVD